MATRQEKAEYARRYRQRPEVKIKEAERSKRRYADRAERERMQSAKLMGAYGVSLDFVRAMHDTQEGKCALCSALLHFGKHTHVDHCHETNVVRGLLCRACNQAEGHIKNSGLTPAEFATRLQTYLDNPPALLAQQIVELTG